MATLKPNFWNLKHKYSTRLFLIHSIFPYQASTMKGVLRRLGVTRLFFRQPHGVITSWIFHTLKFGPWPCRLGNLICRQSWSKVTLRRWTYNSKSTEHQRVMSRCKHINLSWTINVRWTETSQASQNILCGQRQRGSQVTNPKVTWWRKSETKGINSK